MWSVCLPGATQTPRPNPVSPFFHRSNSVLYTISSITQKPRYRCLCFTGSILPLIWPHLSSSGKVMEGPLGLTWCPALGTHQSLLLGYALCIQDSERPTQMTTSRANASFLLREETLHHWVHVLSTEGRPVGDSWRGAHMWLEHGGWKTCTDLWGPYREGQNQGGKRRVVVEGRYRCSCPSVFFTYSNVKTARPSPALKARSSMSLSISRGLSELPQHRS